jgi:hypothetical protein
MIYGSAILTSLIAVVAAAQVRDPVQASSKTNTMSSSGAARRSADSARTVRATRRAQEQFESLRRANLPFRPGAPSRPCDLQVGRFCYWHEDGDSRTNPPPEPERITRGRERLLDALADAGRQLKGDEWVVGQRVRYFLEAGRMADAIAVSADCWASDWWCDALAGLALHQAREYARADSAFTSALAEMTPQQRCRWMDISLLLEGRAAKRYEKLPCADRAQFENRFWWLSQPLYSLAGNDARTEFYARRTMSRLEQQARSAYNISWGRDVDELMMRFGWPTWWSRDHPSNALASTLPSVVGHEPTPSFFFHPSDRLLDTLPVDARPSDWEPRRKLPPTRYAPAYAASFSDLRTQVAIFRRGDSAVVVAAYEPPRDSLFDEGIDEAALALGTNETDPMTVVRQLVGGRPSLPLVARTTWAPLLASVELSAVNRRGIARSRFGVRPRPASGRLALSDILLYRPEHAPSASLDDLARYALGSPRVVTGGRAGVYWELYGVRPAGEVFSVTLTVERVRAGWMTRAAQALRLADKATPLRVRWQEVPTKDGGIVSRAITVDLSSLPAGSYRMQLLVAADDGATAESERLIELFNPR